MLQLLQGKNYCLCVFLQERVKSPMGLMQLSLKLSKQKFHSDGCTQPPRPRNQFFDFRVCLLFVLQDTICHFWLHPWPIYPFSHIVFSYFCCFLLHRQNNFPLDSSPQQTHNDDAIQSQACLMNELGLSSSKQASIKSFVFPRNTSQCFQNL